MKTRFIHLTPFDVTIVRHNYARNRHFRRYHPTLPSCARLNRVIYNLEERPIVQFAQNGTYATARIEKR